MEEGVSRGRPYYRQRDSVGKTDWCLYYNKACSAELAGWLVGSTLDECYDGTYMRNPANTVTPLESGWTYWLGGWQSDDRSLNLQWGTMEPCRWVED